MKYWKPFSSPTRKVWLDDVVHRQPNRWFTDNPPTSWPRGAVGFAVKSTQQPSGSILRRAVTQTREGFLDDLSIEDLVPTLFLGMRRRSANVAS